MITAVKEEIDSKENDKIYQESVNKFCHKLEIFGNGVLSLNKQHQSLSEKVRCIETKLATKVNDSDTETKLKRINEKIIEKVLRFWDL